jgi:hypothetical protein
MMKHRTMEALMKVLFCNSSPPPPHLLLTLHPRHVACSKSKRIRLLVTRAGGLALKAPGVTNAH